MNSITPPKIDPKTAKSVVSSVGGGGAAGIAAVVVWYLLNHVNALETSNTELKTEFNHMRDKMTEICSTQKDLAKTVASIDKRTEVIAVRLGAQITKGD